MCLLDALDAAGFKECKHRCHHDANSAKEYDARSIMSKRCYLQCLVALRDLLAAGVSGFPSGQPNSFYALILRHRKVPPLGLGAKEYTKQLGDEDGEAAELAALLDAPTEPPLARGPLALEDSRARDDTIAAEDDAEDDAASPAGPELAIEDAPQEEESDDMATDGPALLSAPGGDLPKTILGQALRRVKGRTGGGWSYHSRVAVSCRNPLHVGCGKTRSTELGKEKFGPLSAAFFMGAWLSKSDMPMHAHKEYKPSDAEVRAFAEQYAASA